MQGVTVRRGADMKISILSRAVRGLAAVASVAALGGCFLTPGKFDSELVLTKGGAFAFSYEGEITTMTPLREGGDVYRAAGFKPWSAAEWTKHQASSL